ncbi:HAD hydrolase family protein [Lacticaseibacillus pantheris]|uniref:HAD hydrolase family protein n=1 Tax=Lacticaseibacillus pantheris TaxID=171523 RepID=UPI0009E9150E|nr:HAD hydrolase family protein [Lacticaseibacillus pantheris]
MIKLIAIDVDDTLLNPEGKLTNTTAAALREAAMRGAHIVLCTGRPLVGVRDFFGGH